MLDSTAGSRWFTTKNETHSVFSTFPSRRCLSTNQSHDQNKLTSQEDKYTIENFGSLSFPDKIRALIKIGKEFASAALAGVKQLWHEQKRARELRKELAYVSHMFSFGIVHRISQASPYSEAKRDMNREVYLFLRKNRTDLRKLIPILIIWKVPIPFSGSVIPFLVYKYPHLLPSTFSFGKLVRFHIITPFDR